MPPSVSLCPLEQIDVATQLAAIDESREALSIWMPWCTASYSKVNVLTFNKQVSQERSAGSGYTFGILGANGKYCGTCGINSVHAFDRFANLGYWLRSSCVGQGLATAAVRSLATWAFENTDLRRLEIVVAVGHLPSQRVAERAGALREAVLRSRVVASGTQVDAIMFSIVRPSL